MTGFIGKGEQSAKIILERLFGVEVRQQVPLTDLAPSVSELGEHYKKHLCDLVVMAEMPIVVEVNLGHGPIAEAKWRVYKNHLNAANCLHMTIESEECITLFNSTPATLTWQDHIDVIEAIRKAGIICP